MLKTAERIGVDCSVASLAPYIDRIYDAALSPERWLVLLDALRRELQLANLGIVFRKPNDHHPGIIAQVGIDERYDDAFRSHFFKLNPWRPYGPEAEEGRVVLNDSIVPVSEQVRTEFYNDWMRPQRIAHPVTIFLHNSGPQDPRSYIVGFREKPAGPLGERDLEPVRLLVPHLQRAIVIHEKIQGAEARADAAGDALDRIGGGVILLDERGAPVLTNRSADQALAANDGLALGPEGPSASTAKQTNALRRLLSEAATTGAGEGVKSGGVMRLARPSGRRALEVVVTPIRRESSPMFDRRATAALFVADPEARAERAPERLRRIYGFTPTEAEVASRLAAGMRLSEIRDDLGVTIHTLRGHLKQLFAKTDTHRQADLVRVLLAGVAGALLA